MLIRKAHISDFNAIVSLIDNEFTKAGYGFVNKAQIETEIRKGRVLVSDNDGNICGVRIGIDTVWNLVVAKDSRGCGIGKALINHSRPRSIRVKSDPIGHLSNKQKREFIDPTAFYEKLGFKFWGYSFPKHFWQKGKDGKGQYHNCGDNPHIKLYRDPIQSLL